MNLIHPKLYSSLYHAVIKYNIFMKKGARPRKAPWAHRSHDVALSYSRDQAGTELRSHSLCCSFESLGLS